MTTPSKASQRMVPVEHGGQSQFESPLVPMEIADAPDIENVPVASSMHVLMEAVVEIHHDVRQIREALDQDAVIDRMRAMLPAAFELMNQAHDTRPAPQDAQQPPQDRSGDALGTPGGVTGSQGLGEALRAYDPNWRIHPQMRTLADRADVLEDLAAKRLAAFKDMQATMLKVAKERDEARESARLAVETCRHLHQDGLTREEWHTRHCGAMQGLKAAQAKVDDLQRTVDSLNDENTRQSETIGRVRDLAAARDIKYPAKFGFGARDNFELGYRAAQADAREAIGGAQ